MISIKHQEAARRNGKMFGGRKPRTMQELVRDFWSNVKTHSPDRCWEWTACLSRSGYGQFCWNGKVGPAHRFAYIDKIGPVPSGVFVCHRCDNPPCCNPRHLFLGTAADNNKDCRDKGRNSPPPDHSKLSRERVMEIRSKFKPHLVTAPMLAKEYGVPLHIVRHAIYKEIL